MIVLTGVGGVVGSLVARDLETKGEPMRVITRDPSRLPSIAGAEVVQADGFEDTGAIRGALRAGDRVFMVAMHSAPADRVRQHRAFLDAAVAAGVDRLVYLSCVNAGPDAIFRHNRSHGATEEMVRESGLPFAFVRMSMWMDDIPHWFDPDGVIRAPFGDGRISFTYRPEIAQVIAATLTGDDNLGETLSVTGPESLTMAELAATASEVTGDAYGCEPQSRDDWTAKRLAMGRDRWSVEAGLSSWDALDAGEFDLVTDTVQEITGAPPLSPAQWIEQNAGSMPLASR